MIRKFISYLIFWKADQTDEPSSFNLRMMHRINRLAIFMFIVAVVVMLIRYIF